MSLWFLGIFRNIAPGEQDQALRSGWLEIVQVVGLVGDWEILGK